MYLAQYATLFEDMAGFKALLEIIPDVDIGISEKINLYGYSQDGMLPLIHLHSLELFD